MPPAAISAIRIYSYLPGQDSVSEQPTISFPFLSLSHTYITLSGSPFASLPPTKVFLLREEIC